MKDQVLAEISKLLDAKINSKIALMQDNHLAIEIAQEVLKTYAKDSLESDLFAKLKSFGLSSYKIVNLLNQHDDRAVSMAIYITENVMSGGKLNNPAGFFLKTLGDKKKEKSVDEVVDKDWQAVREAFIKRCGLATFNAWLRDVVLVRKGREVELKCKSRFFADYIQKDHAARLQSIWQHVNSEVETIKFIY